MTDATEQRSERGHRQVEHSADLAIEVWAPDETGLLVEGARAVVDVLTGGAEVGDRDARTVELTTLDAEDRLVQWLNEIIFAAVTEGFVTASVTIDLRPDGLSATLHGEAGAGARITTELKSATYHDLEIARDAGGCRARVVIDV